MHKTLLATFIGASVFAVPAFAQSIPTGAGQVGAGTTAHLPAQAGTRAGIGASVNAGATTNGTGQPALGLGSLIKNPLQGTAQGGQGTADTATGPDTAPLGTRTGAEASGH